MISFLISTYRGNCSPLVTEIVRQGRLLQDATRGEGEPFLFEVLVLDDASGDGMAERLWKAHAGDGEVRIIAQEKNGGPASGRNRLAREAQGEWFVFMDSDARVCTDDFVAQYWADREKADVVCGALRNPSPPAPEGCELRYAYERHAEPHRTAAWRNRHPYDVFSTFNFLVNRRVFQTLQFDERCKKYGYEDTLFGLRLEELGFSILHTDNPLIHTGIDSNESFIRKTEVALRTLTRMDKSLRNRVGASRVCQQLQRWGLLPLTCWLFRKVKPALLHNLRGHSPSLLCFKMYKLGCYAAIIGEKTGGDASSSGN